MKFRAKVELIVILCFMAGLFLACATKFLPFILLTVLAVPICKIFLK